MSATDEFESLADWMGEQDWTVNVRDYTDEYMTYVREQPVELLAERLMQSSWFAEHDAQVRAEALREAADMIETPSAEPAGSGADGAPSSAESRGSERSADLAEPVAYALYHRTTGGLIGVRTPVRVNVDTRRLYDVRPLHAHPETPEPTEWEYGWESREADTGEQWDRGGPYASAHTARSAGEELADWEKACSPDLPRLEVVVTRRPAPGPWEPVENTEEER